MSAKEKQLMKREIALTRLRETFEVGQRAKVDMGEMALFEAYCDKIHATYEAFEESHIVISAGVSDEAAKEQERLLYKEANTAYFGAIALYKTFAKEQHEQGTQRSSSQPPVRLPKINLPAFNGDFKVWPTFFELYNSMIHENSQITKIEKFHYLLSSLTGEPRSLLKSVTISEANYQDAYDALVARYQNRRKLSFAYWEEILGLHNRGGTAKELRKLLDVFTENVSLLKNLKFNVESWDFILFYTLLNKLDSDVRQKFECSCQGEEIPTFKQLLEFLQMYCQSLELSSPSSMTAKKKGRSDSSALMAETTTGCIICKGKHMLSECSSFTSKGVNDRFQVVRKNGLCLNCFKPGHRAVQCTEGSCKVCKKKHNVLLHFPPKETKEEPVTVLANSTSRTAVVLLSTALLEVQDGYGQFQQVRVLLDSGSQTNFVTRQCCQRLGLTPAKSRLSVRGLGGNPSLVTKQVSCTIRSRQHPERRMVVDSLVLPKICGDIPASPVTVSWSMLQGLTLADPEFSQPGRIDMLLGAEVFGQVMTGRRQEIEPGGPVALETWFGWSLMGRLSAKTETSALALHVTVEGQLEPLVRQFWELDTFPGASTEASKTDDLVEKGFRDTVSRDSSGRFIVALPFKQEVPLFGNTKAMATRRFFALERRLLNDPELYGAYNEFMREYEVQGHMSVIVPGDSDDMSNFYIPHHPIVKPESQTTKVRVVFDASAKVGNDRSLNDTLNIGPKLQCRIVAILLRFRMYAVAFVTDIKQMYRQILVRKEDRPYQRIVWRSSPDQTLQEYELNTVTYGIAASPFLAIRTLHELAEIGQDKYPDAAKILLSDVYIDDAVTGANTVTKAKERQHELVELLREGKFELHKWGSNEPSLVLGQPGEDDCVKSVSFDNGEVPCVKVLGLRWWTETDLLSYDVKVEISSCTKRLVLSKLARIFDPLGLLCPVTFLAKVLLQRLWILGLEWDEVGPKVLGDQWTRWQKGMESLKSLQIPRYVSSIDVSVSQLHGFCDASEKGFAAAVYLRLSLKNGENHARLLIAKSKVAPLKQRSIPRLELCAAALLADLLVYVREELGMSDTQIVAWTDSMVVLHWIRSQSTRYKPFVGNRVGRIQEALPPGTFRHVPSEGNPADAASRGVFPKDLISQKLWWAGPGWLTEDSSQWPQTLQPGVPVELLQGDCESKDFYSLTAGAEREEFLEQFSSLTRLKRVGAWCLRFKENCARRAKSLAPLPSGLTREEQHLVLMRVIQGVQQSVFAVEMQRLVSKQRLPKAWQKLNPFLDRLGVIRVGSRLVEADACYERKFPILLPRKHVFTDLVINDCHKRYLHPGLQTVHFLLRANYWILSPRRAIRSCLRQCVQCFKANPKPIEPFMGNLPSSRVVEAKAFMTVGIDFGGPFSVRPVQGRGRRTYKLYVCVFVCHATKAIHIELVFSLTSEAFIAALRRFVARRGHCMRINCDNGTNFVGACKKLGSLMREASEAEGIEFQFNPPRAPHFGGLFEAGMKSIKTHLARVIGNQTLTVEEFLTFSTQVEALLNSRPLWDVSSDARDLDALTPGHFLMLAPLTSLPDPDLTNRPLNTLTRWQLIQQMQQSFWRRWKNEYLMTLHQRTKWTVNTSPLPEGTLVIIKEDNVKPLQWELARVVKTHPGKDGVVRVATVRSARGVFQRPTVRLCPLPICPAPSE